MIWADTVAAFLALTGLGCILSAARTARRRPSLSDRLAPFQPSVGDEAEEWLRSTTNS